MKMKTNTQSNYLRNSIIILFVVLFWPRFVDSGNETTTIRPREIPSATPSKNDGLKEWFASVLELRVEKSENDAGAGGGTRNKRRDSPINAPRYVQNLYDQMALEMGNDDRATNGRRRRSINGESYNFGAGGEAVNVGDGPVTIQAIARDEQLAIGDTGGHGYLLQFNLEQLWISNKELQSAELVLAVDYLRLTAPPGAYSVFAYAVDDESQSVSSRARLLISAGSLGILDTFRNNFVKLKVTEAVVRKVLAGGRRSIVFEIFVAYKNPNENVGGANRDLNRQEIGELLHLSSRGAHQPLLVLYSSTADGIGDETENNNRQTRRRRSTAAAATTSTRGSDNDDGCRRHEWWVDLVELFQDNIVKPEGFYANFCAGKCRYPMYDTARWNTTGNAHLRGAYNANWRRRNRETGSNETSTVPDVACVVQSSSPITILYKVGESFLIRRLDAVVANSCMCA